jgi:serine/threonine protein phosphatase PrpC
MENSKKKPDPVSSSPSLYFTQGHSLQGLRPYQEDRYLILPNGDRCLVVVADGLGGHGHGDFASQTCCSIFEKEFEKEDLLQEPTLFLQEAATRTNHRLLLKGQEDPEYRYCGTTVTGFLVQGKTFYLLNAGDSRVYGFDGKKNLTRLTKDHSLVQDLLDQGQITEEEAFVHPRRNMVTASLGVSQEYLRMDVSGPHALEPEMVLLATSDGVHDALTDEQILAILIQEKNNRLAETLAEAALDAGGTDNITVCLLSLNPTYGS